MSDQGMSLRGKLLAMTAMTVIALTVLFTVLLFNSKHRMLEDRENKVRNLVEVAQGILASYDAQVRAGTLSKDDAQAAAKKDIAAMRYDKTEYFWIHDLDDVMVMHPIKAELNGKKLDQLKDKNGKLFFTEMNRVVKSQQAGFVEYYWPKPGAASDVGVPKISYVAGFQPWGWVVGTGIYIDDVDATFREDAAKLILWGLGIVGFIALASYLVSANILKTLGGDPAVASSITRRIASGDLATPIECAPGDQTSLLANLGNMQEHLRQMIGTIVDHAEQVASAATQLLSASEEVTSRARHQSDAASSMAASVEEMAVSIDQVKENAGEANDISQTADKISEEGATVIHGAASEMRRIAEAVQSSSEIVEELGRQSDQISSIVNTIKEIADQTNLLALNAAIEAARAGEQGRGFAVVADEVRKLAERTSLSTTEITDMVAKIQNGTRSAVGSMQAGVEKVSSGVDLANRAGDSINQIREGAQRVSQVVTGISDSITEQSVASNDIAKKLEIIAQMAEESVQAVAHTNDAARKLQTLSASLHETVARFRT